MLFENFKIRSRSPPLGGPAVCLEVGLGDEPTSLGPRS
jgi:hypothetical protein